MQRLFGKPHFAAHALGRGDACSAWKRGGLQRMPQGPIWKACRNEEGRVAASVRLTRLMAIAVAPHKALNAMTFLFHAALQVM
ncbi:hypothetical protein GOP47_0019467 [Adiantum capillus-veneris]|uniref:Uncharacterized protein n=1 Tax=Adiantum capillus-veneris TaxID=13818 RepID=A0A9D4UBJ1_ADICA|nr:hypothetical protein GOP47_0019467 [Adiantum capillus-veneris]